MFISFQRNIYIILYPFYLVGGIPTPLKNMSSSVGMMEFPTEWKNNPNVPNHQPAVTNQQSNGDLMVV